MAHDLVPVIALSLLSSLDAWLAYNGGLLLRREQRFHENLRIVHWLGVSTILSVLGLGPFFPANHGDSCMERTCDLHLGLARVDGRDHRGGIAFLLGTLGRENLP